MEKTEQEIKELIKMFENWGMMNNLNANERKHVELCLRQIAGAALMEANNKLQQILPSLYYEITTPNKTN